MRRMALVLLLGLGACAQEQAARPQDARPALAAEWFEGGRYRWPPADGFAAPPTFILLPPGVLLDRFGGDGGRFLSPKGATFRSRALPTICADQRYTAYRVVQPLLVRVGSAAPWFGEPGGATQIYTDATVAQLLADGTLAALPPQAAPCE